VTDALVAAIAAGDTDAFARWMRGGERPLRDSLRRFAAAADTEAVLQETLLRLWQVAPRFAADGRPNGFLRLGIRIAHNLAVSEVRRTARDVELDDGDLERHLSAAAGETAAPPDPILRSTLARCRDELPEQPRRALDARLEGRGGAPDAVLAQSLRMRKNTFLQNVTRARRLLAECLERHGVDLAQEIA
jgi:RNA polymerase sigma-70 factor (ECF subfamily)